MNEANFKIPIVFHSEFGLDKTLQKVCTFQYQSSKIEKKIIFYCKRYYL